MKRVKTTDKDDFTVPQDLSESEKVLAKAKKMNEGRVPLKVSETITIYVKPKNKNRKYADKWLKRYEDNLYGRTCKSGFED